ncbi:hypothetical protein BC829DRAFT_12933 [Chytridium lagenaria]|nr:hypothetical protein BC829DRAFT_12933 [Chytridium lagenaria]
MKANLALEEPSSAKVEPKPLVSERDWMMAPDLNPFRTVEKNTDNDSRVLEAQRKQAIAKERELNPFFAHGGAGLPTDKDEGASDSLRLNLYYAQLLEPPRKTKQFGDSGSNWRMIKLRKVFEITEREGRPLEEVALERYGSLEEFEEAKREKEFLDNRKSGGGRNRNGDRHDDSRRHHAASSERFSFQRRV